MKKCENIEQFYLKHKDHIYNFILRLSHDHEIAMDVTQQTFLIALKSDFNFDFIKSWLITLARNLFYEEVKYKNNIQFEMIDESIELNFNKEEYIQIPLSSALKSLQVVIDRVITNMPIARKEIVILYFIENLSIVEITTITKRSIIDIKVNLHHAIILFEANLITNMKGKITASEDTCRAYNRITQKYKQSDINTADLKLINCHISNCKYCRDNYEQMKRTEILLNLIPLFIAPYKLNEIIKHTKLKITKHSILQSAKIIPYLAPTIIH